RAELADPTRAECAGAQVYFVDETDVDLGHVRADGHEVTGEVFREESPEMVVDPGVLEQRLPDAPGDAADHLTPRRLRVDDAARAVDSDRAPNARDAERLVDTHLDEHRAEAVHRVRVVLADPGCGRGRPLALGREPRLAALRDDLRVATQLGRRRVDAR